MNCLWIVPETNNEHVCVRKAALPWHFPPLYSFKLSHLNFSISNGRWNVDGCSRWNVMREAHVQGSGSNNNLLPDISQSPSFSLRMKLTSLWSKTFRGTSSQHEILLISFNLYHSIMKKLLKVLSWTVNFFMPISSSLVFNIWFWSNPNPKDRLPYFFGEIFFFVVDLRMLVDMEIS